MIRCEHCGSPIRLKIERESISETEGDVVREFKVCFLIWVPHGCLKCGTVVPIDNEKIAGEAVISEGARLMSARNPHRFTKATGSAAAKKRFGKG